MVALDNTDRPLPHNIEAEQALLGAILVNNEALERVDGFLDEEHFFDPLHGQIYQRCRACIQKGLRTTPITLKTDFEGHANINDLTVPQYLGRLAASATTVMNAEHYGRTIYNLSVRRGIVIAAQDTIAAAYEAPQEIDGVELLDDGTGGDITPGDGVFSAEVVFPIGTYRFLQYKYFCAESDTSGTYECETLPDRTLTLDDVNGCVTVREGPMVIEDLWNWCEPVTGIGQNIEQKTWGEIKSMYKVR